MKGLFSKKIVLALALTVLVGGSFLVPGVAEAQLAIPQGGFETGGAGSKFLSDGVGGLISLATDALSAPVGWLAILFLQISTWLTWAAGAILNYVVQETVVGMSDKVREIDTLNRAWGSIRDLANMGFIFILLYAAITTILGIGNDNKKLIRNIVIVAVLINFSLFFTRFVIDTSNILAVFFYEAAATENALETEYISGGLATSLMAPLQLTSLWNLAEIASSDPNGALQNYATALGDGKNLVIIGVMGSIISLIAAFIFFAIALMFVIRFVVLVLVMILSPIAFIAMVFPSLNSQANKWWDALLGQAFFAPIYFVLTWVVITITSGGLFGGEGGTLSNFFIGSLAEDGSLERPNIDSIGLLMNFIVVAVFLIATLVIAKDWANKASDVKGLTKWATGFAGGATFGAVGFAGRQTVGRAGQAVAESETLKKAREWSNKRGGIIGTTVGTTTRFAQNRAKSVGSGSFDLRSTGISGQLDAGKAGGKGGYEAWRKDVAKKEKEYAESQAPSESVKARARIAVEQAEEELKVASNSGDTNRIQIAEQNLNEAKRRQLEIKGLSKEDAKKQERERKENLDSEKDKILEEDSVINAEAAAKKELNKLENELKAKQRRLALTTIPAEREALEAEIKKQITMVEFAEEEVEKATEAAKNRRRELENEYNNRKNTGKIVAIPSIADERKKKEASRVEDSFWAKGRGYNYAAAAAIRKDKKSAKELIDDALKDTGEKSESSGEEKPEDKKEGGGNPTP